MKHFGENLKSARQNLKMNQKALGDAIGVGQTTIANYEKGVRFPTGELLKKIGEILNVSLDQLMGHGIVNHDLLDENFNIHEYQEKFESFLLEGNEQDALVMIWALNPSIDNILMIYEDILMPTMIDVGTLWEEGKISIALEHFASGVVQKIISMISTIPDTVKKKGYKAVCMSLSAEPHTIGMRMISEYMNLTGVQSFYIGSTVPTDSLIDMLKDKKADILAISATMESHLDNLSNLIKIIRHEKEFKHLKIIVGGQAFASSKLTWEDVGADGYSRSFEGLHDWLIENGYI